MIHPLNITQEVLVGEILSSECKDSHARHARQANETEITIPLQLDIQYKNGNTWRALNLVNLASQSFENIA